MEWVEYEGAAVQEPDEPSRYQGKNPKKKGSVYRSGAPYPAEAMWTPQGANETGATVYWSTPTTGSSTYASASSILNPAIQNK